MVTTSEIILAIIIVSLSVVMPIYYYYQRKKNPKQDNKPKDNPEIKNYIDRINEITQIKVIKLCFSLVYCGVVQVTQILLCKI